jgi:FkbM family methyltransferase
MPKVVFVLAATWHGPMIVSRLDYRTIEGRGSYGVGHDLLEHGVFQPQEIAAACRLLTLRRQHHGDGVVAVDGGANIGTHALAWAAHMAGWGEVLAVEAQERVCYALAGNIALNNGFNARALHAALGATDGELEVPVLDYGAPSSLGSFELKAGLRGEYIGQPIDYAAGPTCRVRQLALDTLALPRLDFLKLDIEGMELEALQGAARTIESQRPVLQIELIKTDTAILQDMLRAWGYRFARQGMNCIAVHADDPVRADMEKGLP